MLLDVNRKLLQRSDRVKGVDFHPTEPWLITGLYNGSVNIYNHETGALIKAFEVAEVPVRCVRFIARKDWFVAGSDDFQLRVFNYNTHEKVTAFEAHPDYIRCLTVHPTLSLVLTGSDDLTIKAFDWDKQWRCIRVFEGHTHYIMNLAVNPKDTNTFASSCLDRTVKMWSLSSSTPNYTLDAHNTGVNYVEFYPGSDKPYLATCADDRSIKVWDYVNKSCVQTMESHTSNVSFAVFHPRLPVLVSGSEDGTVKIWNSGTYRLENTLSYSLERAWCVAIRPSANDVAVGFDEGVVVIKLGRDDPIYSVDYQGKLVYTRNSDVLGANLQQIQVEEGAAEGQRIALASRDLGSTEIFATSILHSPNGRFVTVVGDGEYIIYTALAWRNKAYGSGSSFAWAGDSNTYAILENRTKVKLYKNFKEKTTLGGFPMDGLHGGTLLGARGSGFVIFWNWDTNEVVRRIDADARDIVWSGTGNLVAVISDESFYILRYDGNAYNAQVEAGIPVGDEGVEAAFEVIVEVNESVKTSKWIGECFVYTNSTNRLNYLIGSETESVTVFDQPMYILSYVSGNNRICVADKDFNVFGYSLNLDFIEYQSAILRDELDAAAEILPSIPVEQHTKLAHFLEGRNLKELAMKITTDPDHKFDLALSLDDLDTALEITEKEYPEPEAVPKWKSIGDRALAVWRFDLAKQCFEKASDLMSLMLLYMAIGDRDGLSKVSIQAEEQNSNNLAFVTRLQLGDTVGCVDLLIKTQRAPEAALFARTYVPSKVSESVSSWRTELESAERKKLAAAVASPAENSELFSEGWEEALERETKLGQQTQADVNENGVITDGTTQKESPPLVQLDE